MEEKDKTKIQPLRDNPVDSDPNPQLSCHKAAAGIMWRSQVERGRTNSVPIL